MKDSDDALQRLGRLDPLPMESLTLKALAIEDRPDGRSVEDPKAIAAILGFDYSGVGRVYCRR